MTQADLFAEPMIAGLAYRSDCISAAEEAELLGHLHALDLAPFRFQGWTGNRKTQSFGWRYDFDDASFTPAGPVPDWLLPLRATAATLAGAAPEDFVHVLIARYDPGAGIGWHRDRPVFDQVVGISLNSLARLRFRRRTASGFERFALNVEPAPLSPCGRRKGKPSSRSKARASSSLCAVVTNVMSMPRVLAILSISISGKIICSRSPSE